MTRHMMWASTTVVLLLTALYGSDLATAHEGLDMEQDPCLRQIGDRSVHFSAYQPQFEIKDQYCTEIPQEGDTFLVIDLLDPTLRDEPVGMRVVKGDGRNATDVQIVADIRPSTHPDGVLRSEVRLDEGLYTVTIASERHTVLKRPQYLLKVHLIDYQKLALSLGGPLIGLLLLSWFLYKLIRSRWLRSLWTPTPSS